MAKTESPRSIPLIGISGLGGLGIIVYAVGLFIQQSNFNKQKSTFNSLGIDWVRLGFYILWLALHMFAGLKGAIDSFRLCLITFTAISISYVPSQINVALYNLAQIGNSTNKTQSLPYMLSAAGLGALLFSLFLSLLITSIDSKTLKDFKLPSFKKKDDKGKK